MKEPDIKPGDRFRERVWAFVRSVPPGKVVTYGQVAAVLGVPFAARAVGSVLHHTPGEANVPCQRVVNRWGRLAPIFGWGGAEQHRMELEAEGVAVRPDMTVDLETYQWWPDPLTSMQEGQVAEPITVVEYDPHWPSLYEVERKKLQRALGPLVLEIHHVGSTSVVRLAAKPVIDILVGIREYPLAEKAIQSVVALGYEYMGEYGIPRRHYFHKGKPRTHHVHIIEMN
ncbi:MAG TPA: methylated-DNA--[protein]-cysteine S-methyltransferase, partial [Chloroflexia bacterium]|nr:methylated-DNA--[protein]-cysteine S-methyltransferase [Chloroflexia bacterium]